MHGAGLLVIHQWGKMMKKFLTSLVICMTVMPAMAERSKWGENNSCYVALGGWNEFYYCGAQNTGCAGKKQNKSKQKGYWYQHLGKFTHNGVSNTCCQPVDPETGKVDKTATGTFKPTGGLIAKPQEQITVTLGNGKQCKKTRTYDICGGWTDSGTCQDATCPSGQVFHAGKCVAPCPAGQIFSSPSSTTCMTCTSGMYQGVGADGYCVTCNKDAGQIFMNGTCVDKDAAADPANGAGVAGASGDGAYTLRRYTNYAMQTCFMCPYGIATTNCLDYVGGYLKLADDETGFMTDRNKCRISDADLQDIKIMLNQSGGRGAGDTTTTTTGGGSGNGTLMNGGVQVTDIVPIGNWTAINGGTTCTNGQTQNCIVLNGAGTQSCINGRWGLCVATSCNTGYTKSGNACIKSSTGGGTGGNTGGGSSGGVGGSGNVGAGGGNNTGTTFWNTSLKTNETTTLKTNAMPQLMY